VTELKIDASGRALALRWIDWDRLYRPGTVVVIGATDTPGPPHNQWLQIRERLGARGARVVPIHPKKAEVSGDTAYPDVHAIPGEIDVAVILVRDPLSVLQECLEKGVRFAFVFSAGFGEVGTAEGLAGAARLAELGSGSMRIIGPNTNLNFYEPWRQDLPGKKLAIVTQSGFQGRPLTQGQVLGIPIHTWATLGNEADMEWADFTAYLASRPDVGAVATFVEGFVDGRTLQLAADTAARHQTPIICIKVGRTEQGAAMAQAHTGHLTGSDAVHDAVFHQYGVIRVDDLDEAIEIGGLFCHAELPSGSGGVAVYAMSGGTASHVADLCGAMGLDVPRFSADTVRALGELLPWYLRRDNPVDSGGVITAKPENRTVLELMRDDPAVDVLFCPITGVFPGMSDALARDAIALHEAGGKPVVVAWTSPLRDDDSYRALCTAGVPLFHSLTAAVKGMKALAEWSSFTRHRIGPFDVVPTQPSPAAEAGRAVLACGGPYDEVRAKQLLAAYGIPTVAERVAGNVDDALRAAGEFGYPVVLKVLSPDLAHKSDLGLVEVGVRDDASLRRLYDELLRRVAANAPEASVSGILVQPMVTGAVAEVILGLSHSAPFGPTLLFGLGGVFTEVFADVAFAVPPFDRAYAREVVMSTKGSALLQGLRGRPAGDIEALLDVLMALQRLAVELGDEIGELDINPLLVMPDGVIAVDALVVGRE
jgi:acyl-CoA synthetase (NDP forming)